jgi:hypothetical protein
MKTISNALLIIISLSIAATPQQNDYWKNAPAEGSKIYSIFFADHQNGYASSANNEIFITKDSGVTWNYSKSKIPITKINKDKELWSADIYCSAMQTTDGGTSWLPYSKKEQDHFCKVYLKDPNVEFKTASEFLNKVTSKILSGIKNNEIASLVNNPQQCTEYYSNETEGWALGWCMKNFKFNDRIKNN